MNLSRNGKLLLAGSAVLLLVLVGAGTASAAPNPPAPGPGPGPTPGPAPGPGLAPTIPAGTYAVTTSSPDPAGQLALRSTAEVDTTLANLVEWLPHLSTVIASGATSNGFAWVTAPDGKAGWASLNFLTAAS